MLFLLNSWNLNSIQLCMFVFNCILYMCTFLHWLSVCTNYQLLWTKTRPTSQPRHAASMQLATDKFTTEQQVEFSVSGSIKTLFTSSFLLFSVIARIESSGVFQILPHNLLPKMNSKIVNSKTITKQICDDVK